MITYVFVQKDTSDVFYTSQFSEQDAWTRLREMVSNTSDWKLKEKAEENRL